MTCTSVMFAPRRTSDSLRAHALTGKRIVTGEAAGVLALQLEPELVRAGAQIAGSAPCGNLLEAMAERLCPHVALIKVEGAGASALTTACRIRLLRPDCILLFACYPETHR